MCKLRWKKMLLQKVVAASRGEDVCGGGVAGSRGEDVLDAGVVDVVVDMVDCMDPL